MPNFQTRDHTWLLPQFLFMELLLCQMLPMLPRIGPTGIKVNRNDNIVV